MDSAASASGTSDNSGRSKAEVEVIVIGSSSEDEDTSPELEVVYCGPGENLLRSRKKHRSLVGYQSDDPSADRLPRPRSAPTTTQESPSAPNTARLQRNVQKTPNKQKRSGSVASDPGPGPSSSRKKKIRRGKRSRNRKTSEDFDTSESLEDGETVPGSISDEVEETHQPDELAFPEPRFSDMVIAITDSAFWLVLTEQSIIIAGICRVNCIVGSAEICGYALTPESGQLTIPSLGSENWLSVFGNGNPIDGDQFEKQASLQFEKEFVDPCRRVVDRWPGRCVAVLLLSSTNHISDPLMWRCSELFPQLQPKIIRHSVGSAEEFSAPSKGTDRTVVLPAGKNWRELFPGCTVISPQAMNGIRTQSFIDFKNDFWDRIKTEVSQCVTSTHPVILLCGSKNVGKSTTVRFIVNFLLRLYPKVHCFDCDLGQSECNPPGCCALHSCTKPLLGAPFCRLHDPDAACYLAEVSPSGVRHQYKRGLEFVFGKRTERVPIVVNTMGWIEKLGLDLLHFTSELTKPDLIIELVKEKETGVSASLYRKPSCRVITLYSAAEKAEPASHVAPAIKRKMSILSYLSASSPTFGPINESTPYRIKFSNISLYFTEVGVSVSHLLTVLDGSYVGLIQLDNKNGRPVRRDVYGDVNVLREFPLGNCLGFGIVRGIDTKARCLFVLTPLADGKMQDVNVLMHGTITVPDEVYLTQNLGKWEGPTPKMQYQYMYERE
ncbi:polynucleotide 5'-hydroxyl-kinase NOL9-like isoform X2 [Paramacrobiotus metropolitanus]|uniref:polynucleotide 5'-hydroxyl-kinase NOL9-like isoform X2 n=1 Tax=Paramacrobiotus metropolitanus TaxID=2943436 RepID=UPI002445C2B8|nr:polynucleotide 5'-hydroxyl-kinase NOL9-like isoform X2 [Paramacrobiotus metropolitanus]